jgi:hypothetical protein
VEEGKIKIGFKKRMSTLLVRRGVGIRRSERMCVRKTGMNTEQIKLTHRNKLTPRNKINGCTMQWTHFLLSYTHNLSHIIYLHTCEGPCLAQVKKLSHTQRFL